MSKVTLADLLEMVREKYDLGKDEYDITPHVDFSDCGDGVQYDDIYFDIRETREFFLKQRGLLPLFSSGIVREVQGLMSDEKSPEEGLGFSRTQPQNITLKNVHISSVSATRTDIPLYTLDGSLLERIPSMRSVTGTLRINDGRMLQDFIFHATEAEIC